MIQGNKLLYNLEHLVNKKPIIADVYLTNFCNNKCGYCMYTRNVTVEQKKYMSFDNFVIYAKRCLELGVKSFILTGGGEPTINPDFDKITNWLEENKIPYGINTNFNVLKKIKPVYLKISLDGYDKESYKKTRGVDSFDKVIENVKKYIDWKKETGAKTNVGLQFLVTRADEIMQRYEAVKSLEVDYFVFRPLEIPYEKTFRDVEGITNILDLLKSKDDRITINYKWQLVNKKFKGCPTNFTQIALDVDGSVIYCCQSPNDKVGHILDDDILEKKKRYRKDYSKCDVPCRLTGVHQTYEEINKKPDDFMFV